MHDRWSQRLGSSAPDAAEDPRGSPCRNADEVSMYRCAAPCKRSSRVEAETNAQSYSASTVAVATFGGYRMEYWCLQKHATRFIEATTAMMK